MWWSSPVALMWSETDAAEVEELLVMEARSLAGATAAERSEIRQLKDRFGLSPQARRKLYWRIEGVDVPSIEACDLGDGGEGAASLPSAGGESDPRLRLVDGGKAAG